MRYALVAQALELRPFGARPCGAVHDMPPHALVVHDLTLARRVRGKHNVCYDEAYQYLCLIFSVLYYHAQ